MQYRYEPLMRWIPEPGRKPGSPEELVHSKVIGWTPAYLVAIYDYAVPDADATERDGRPRFRNVPYIGVRCLDDKGRAEPDYAAHPLRETEKQQWPRAWAAYCAIRDQPSMLALELLPRITAADVCELHALEIHTVEALAAHPGELGTLEPFRALARRLLTLAKPRVRPAGDGTFTPVTEAA